MQKQQVNCEGKVHATMTKTTDAIDKQTTCPTHYQVRCTIYSIPEANQGSVLHPNTITKGLPVDVQRVRRRDNTRHPPGGPGEPLSTVAAPPNTETTSEGTKPPSPSMCFIFHHTPTLMLSKCMATVRLHSFRRQKAATKIIPSPKCTSVPKPLVNSQEKVNPTLRLKNSYHLLDIVCIKPQRCYSKTTVKFNVNPLQVFWSPKVISEATDTSTML
ncbi:hypothetical protein E2C01_017709 [Portunus trituberculatus]|uniref:Uncharacterized protein n=1 Tax=Portunus trituberculatus TaxID=210409 RepID=A0A5B7DT74_PORTR|nr:hypothetical protein [Portunus trituberculatus]